MSTTQKDTTTETKEVKVLSNKDILASQGLVEIFDPAVGAYRQVPIEEAKKMLASLEENKKRIEELSK